MSSVAPFLGFVPRPESALRLACPPYDVLSIAEARRLATDRDSFVRVVRSEVDFPEGADAYADKIYLRARQNLNALMTRGLLVPSAKDSFYIYRLDRGGRTQTGLVAAVSLREYEEGRIKKHELTRPEKEDDRARHIEITRANTGQVFLTYRATDRIGELISELCQAPPRIEFIAEDRVEHALWIVDSHADAHRLRAAFDRVPALYVADGHHRLAASWRVWKTRASLGASEESPFARVMATLFPHNQLEILPYNRVVRDLNGLSPENFLAEVEKIFDVRDAARPEPDRAGTFGMFLGGKWLRIEPRALPANAPPEKRLDAAVLQDLLLRPILSIDDPRTNPRIEFIGGIKGPAALSNRCAELHGGVAFACYPAAMEQLLAVADAGAVMPPKSTWFEPKLLSGLVVRRLAD